MSPTVPRTHYLDDIIKIIANADRMRAQNFEQGVKFQEEQKVNQAQIDAWKAQEKHRQDVEKRLEKEHGDFLKQQEIINAAAKNVAEAQHFATKVDLAKRINAGETIPGAEYSKIYSMPGSEQFPAMNLPAMKDVRQVTVPMGGDKTYQAVQPTPEAYAKSQAGLERITSAPAQEGKEEVEKIKQAGEAFKIADQHMNAMELARFNRGEIDKLEEKKMKNRLEVGRLRQAATGSDTLDDDYKSTLANSLERGITTKKKEMANQGSVKSRAALGQFFREYTANGGVDMDDEQQSSLVGFSQAANLLKIQDDYLDNADDIQSGGIETEAKLWLRKQLHSRRQDTVNRLHGQIESTGSQIARDLGVIGTQSNKDTISAIIGNAPGMNDPLDQAIAKRNTNVQRLLNRFYATYHNYKGEALERLKKQAGIDNLEDEYNIKRRQKTTTSPTAQGVTIPPVQQQAAPTRKTAQQIYDEIHRGGSTAAPSAIPKNNLRGPEPRIPLLPLR